MRRFVGGVSLRRQGGRPVRGAWPLGLLEVEAPTIKVRLRFGRVFGADSRFEADCATAIVEPCQRVIARGVRVTNGHGDHAWFWKRRRAVLKALADAGCAVSDRVVDVTLGDFL